jgi:hypothetical protein
MSISEKWDKIKIFLHGRKRAYQMVFSSENQYTKVVLADLAKFCRAESSTFNADPRIHAALEGRREVFLRITQHLHLTPDELFKLYAQKGD